MYSGNCLEKLDMDSNLESILGLPYNFTKNFFVSCTCSSGLIFCLDKLAVYICFVFLNNVLKFLQEINFICYF